MPDIQSSPYNYNNELADTGTLAPITPSQPSSLEEQGGGGVSVPKIPNIYTIMGNSENLVQSENPWLKSNKYNNPINTRLSDTQRYADSEYGFNPYNINTEVQYGDREGNLAAIGKTLAKTGASLLGTTAETLATIPMAINAIASGDISKMENNSINNGVADMMEGLEQSMPTFQTTYENEHPIANYLPFKGNGWSKVIQNMAFVGGAMLGSVIQDAAIGAATGGIGEIPLIGMQVANLSSKLGKVMAGGTKAFKGLTEAVQAGTKAETALNAASTLTKIAEKSRYALAVQTAAWSESAMEANQTHRDLRADLSQDFYNSHGYDAIGQDREDLENYARDGANANLLANVAILSVTDAIQFPTLLKPFAAAKRAIESTLEGGVRVGLKEGSKEVFEEIVNPAKGIKKILSKYVSPRAVESIAVESTQEGLQTFSGGTAEDYYRRKYNDATIDSTDNIIKALGEGYKKTFFTQEGKESIILGGLIGAVMHGGRLLIEKARGLNNNRNLLTTSTLNLLNRSTLTGTLQNKYNEAATSVSIQKDMEDAVKENDIYKFKNLQHDQLYNLVDSGVKANRFDLRIAQLQQLKELSPEEFKTMFNMEFSEGTRKTASAYVDALIDKAYKMKGISDKVNRTFRNPYTGLKSKIAAEKIQNIQNEDAFESYKSQLGYSISKLNDNRRRIDDLGNEISDIIPNIDTDQIVNLTSKDGINQVIKDLSSKMRSIEKDESLGINNTGKRDKAFIQDKIDVLNSNMEKFNPDLYLTHVTELLNYYKNNESLKGRESIDTLDVISALNRAGDIYKLGVDNERATQYYNKLLTKPGYEALIKDFGEDTDRAVDKIVVADNGQLVDKSTLPPAIVPQIDDLGNPVQDTTIKEPVITSKEAAISAVEEQKAAAIANITEPDPVKAEEQKTAFEEEFNKQIQAIQAQPEAVVTAAVEAGILSGAAADIGAVNPTKFTNPQAEAEKQGLYKEKGNINPQDLLNKLNNKSYEGTPPYEKNLEDVIFQMPSDEIRNKVTLKVSKNEREKAINPTQVIKGKDIYRYGTDIDVEMVVDDKPIGRMSNSNTLVFKRGNEYLPLLEMTPEEYAKVTGNTPETYDDFMTNLEGYHTIFSAIQSEFNNGAGKTEFSNKDIYDLFDVVPLYGGLTFSTVDSASTPINKLRFRHEGDVVISLPVIYNAETGIFERTKTPTILGEKDLSPENYYDLQEFLDNNLKQIHGLNSRYVFISRLPDGYHKLGIFAARPDKADETKTNKLVQILSTLPDTLTKGVIQPTNEFLRNELYIADSNNDKGTKTNMSFSVTKDGQVDLNLFNKDKKVNEAIRLPKAQLQGVKDIPALVAIMNEYAGVNGKNPRTRGLNLKFSKDDFKTNIVNDDTASMKEVEDKLTVASSPFPYKDYSMRIMPIGAVINADTPRALREATERIRAARTFSKPRVLNALKKAFRIEYGEAMSDVGERRFMAEEPQFDPNGRLNATFLAKILGGRVNVAGAAKLADKLGNVKVDEALQTAPRPKTLTKEEHKVIDAIEASETIPEPIKKLAETNPKAAVQELQKQIEEPKVEAPIIVEPIVKEALQAAKEKATPMSIVNENGRPQKEGDSVIYSFNLTAKKASKIEFTYRKPEVEVKESSVKGKFNVVVDGKPLVKAVDAQIASDEADKFKVPSWYYQLSSRRDSSEVSWEKAKGKDLANAQDAWDIKQGLKQAAPVTEEVAPVVQQTKPVKESYVLPEAGMRWLVPVSPENAAPYAHVSEIQQAFIEKRYDALILEGKLTEQGLRDIVRSMKVREYDDLGKPIETIDKNIYDDWADQVMFRVSNPDKIENVEYWTTIPKESSQDFPDYLKTISEITKNGQMLEAINNGLLDPQDAKKILDATRKSPKVISITIDNKLKELEKVKKEVKVVEKKAKEEEKQVAIENKSVAAPIEIKAEGIDTILPQTITEPQNENINRTEQRPIGERAESPKPAEEQKAESKPVAKVEEPTKEEIKKKSISQDLTSKVKGLLVAIDNDDITTTKAAEKAEKFLEKNELGIRDNLPNEYKRLQDIIAKADNMSNKVEKAPLSIEDLPDAVDEVREGSTVIYKGTPYQVKSIEKGKFGNYYEIGDLLVKAEDTTVPYRKSEAMEAYEQASEVPFIDPDIVVVEKGETPDKNITEQEQKSHFNGQYLSSKETADNDVMLTYVGLKTILNKLQNKFGINYKVIDDPNMQERGRFKDGVVLININKFNKDTPFHEYLHPFVESIKRKNQDLYNKLHELLAEDPEGKAELRRAGEYYQDSTPEEQRDEALVSYLGKAMSDLYTDEGLVKERPFWEKLLDLLKKFRSWLQNIVEIRGNSITPEGFSEIHVPQKNDNIKIKESKFVENMTLQDFVNFVGLSDIRIDLSSTIDITNKMDRAQKATFDTSTEDGKLLKKIHNKLTVLSDTGNRRVSSSLLQSTAANLYESLNNKGLSEGESITAYIKQGVDALKFAHDEMKRVQQIIYGDNKLSLNEVTDLNKRLQVSKELIAMFDDVNGLSKRIAKTMPKDERDRMDDIFAENDRKKNEIHKATATLLTEWLYPYIEEAQKDLDPKYENFRLSKQDFKNKLYSADADPGVLNYWLSSIGSAKDPVNAIVKQAMKDVFKKNTQNTDKINIETQELYANFLKDNNLKNDRISTSEFYKKNYMRKASNWEKTGEDKEGNPEYNYVDRWAFHTEFYSDKFAKDKKAFIEGLGEQPDPDVDKAAFDAYIDKIYAWDIANMQTRKTGEKLEVLDDEGKGTGVFKDKTENVPSDAYKNPEYNRLISSDKFYKQLLTLYNESNDRLGESGLSHGIVPQVSKGRNAWSDLKWNRGLKENAKTIGKIIADKYRGDDNTFKKITEDGEINFGNNDINLDGTVYRTIKHPHTRLLDENDLDTVLGESVLKYHHAAAIYDDLKTAEPNIKALQDFVNGQGIGMKGRGVKMVTTGKLGVILDKYLHLPQLKEAHLERLNKQLNSFINDVVYGEEEFKDNLQIGSFTLSLNKLGSNLGFLTALNNMAFNIGGGIANVTIGNVQLTQEATGGKYFNLKNLGKAQKTYTSNISNFMKDVTNIKKSLWTQRFIKDNVFQGEFRDKYGKNIVGSVAQRYANLDTIFFVNHAGEHQIQANLYMAMCEGQKVPTKSGKSLTLFDAFQLDKNGNSRLIDDAIWSDKDHENFLSRFNSKNYELNGNYSSFDKAMIQRKWYGKMAIIYRKYLYNAFRARYGKARMDYELRDVIKGNYNTFFSKLADDVQKYKFDAARRFFTREGWNQEEKYAYNKTVFELSLLIGTMIFANLIGAGEDKKDSNWGKEQFYLRLLNLKNDLSTYTTASVSDMMRIVKNPSAILGTLDKYGNFFGQLTDPLEEYKRNTGIFKKGDLKLKVAFLKAFPGVRQVVNILEPAEQKKFFIMKGN